MKKLIGIILAVCMLFTVAAAAKVTGSADPAEDGSMKIIVQYGNIPDGAQATMLAYEVTGVANASADTEYKNQTETPIVGIDQEPVGNAFDVVLADTFMDNVEAGASRLIVVKVGGTDMEPMSWLVTFTKAAVTPGPGEGGGEGGETPVDPPVNPPVNPDEITITVKYGDVNGDGNVSGTDASLILEYAAKLREEFTDKDERTIPLVVGDVNGDGATTGTDASLILEYAAKLREGFTDKDGNELTEYTYTYVAPEA